MQGSVYSSACSSSPTIWIPASPSSSSSSSSSSPPSNPPNPWGAFKRIQLNEKSYPCIKYLRNPNPPGPSSSDSSSESTHLLQSTLSQLNFSVPFNNLGQESLSFISTVISVCFPLTDCFKVYIKGG